LLPPRSNSSFCQSCEHAAIEGISQRWEIEASSLPGPRLRGPSGTTHAFARKSRWGRHFRCNVDGSQSMFILQLLREKTLPAHQRLIDASLCTARYLHSAYRGPI